MTTLLHITPRDQWHQATLLGTYRAASLETEGFIHCSTPAQIIWVANTFFRGQSGLVLLCIDPARVQAEIRLDAVAGVGEFPHLYGELNLDAVTAVLDFPPQDDGQFELPAGIV